MRKPQAVLPKKPKQEELDAHVDQVIGEIASGNLAPERQSKIFPQGFHSFPTSILHA